MKQLPYFYLLHLRIDTRGWSRSLLLAAQAPLWFAIFFNLLFARFSGYRGGYFSALLLFLLAAWQWRLYQLSWHLRRFIQARFRR